MKKILLIFFGIFFIGFTSAAAPSFISAGAISQDTVGAVTVTPTCPTHQADDILVVYAGSDIANDMATATAGWATIATLGGTNNDGLWLWFRATNDSSPNPTITASDDDVFTICYVIRGADTTGTPYEDATTAGDLNTVNVTTATITTTAVDRFVVTFAGMEDDPAWSTSPPPTGWTLDDDQGTAAGTDWKFTVISKTESSATTVPETSVGIQAGVDGWNSLTLAFLPGADATNPTYSDNETNNTQVGLDTLFSLYWDDDTALHPNGQCIFSTNNTGSWVNDTAANFTTTPQWFNVTKTLNSTEGIDIGWRNYCNDTAGNNNASEIFVLTTTPPPQNSTWTTEMNDSVTLVYHMNTTDVPDALGRNDGTNYSLTTTAGVYGNAIDFNGNGGYIDVGNLSGWASTSNGTISMWFKADYYNESSQYVMSHFGVNDRLGFYLDNDTTYDGLGFIHMDNAGGLAAYDANYDNGSWFHAVGVWNDSDTALYINGELVDTHTGDTVKAWDDDVFEIARAEGTNDRFFDGQMDEVYVFDRRLNVTEIGILFNNGWYGTAPFVDNAPVVNLNSPSNNSNLSSASVTFNCTVTDDLDLDNATLYINGASNQTNSSGVSGVYLWTIDFVDGNNYNWTCGGIDNESKETIASYQYFNVDTVPPTVTILSPTAQNYTANTSIDLNYTTDGDNCWYSINGGDNLTLDNCQNISLGNGTGEVLTFGTISDLHYDDGGIDLLEQTITRMNNEYEIDFVVLTGDGITNSLAGCAGDQAAFHTVNDALNDSEGDSFYLYGNHEFDNCVESDWAGYPGVFNGSAEYGSFRIYLVNASKNNESVPDYQLANIDGFLKDGNHRTFMFGHHPALYWIDNVSHYYFDEAGGFDKMYLNNNETFMQYLENNTYNGDPKTLAYISAHLHMQNTSDTQYRNNVFYPSMTSMWEELDSGSPVLDQNETYVWEVNDTHIKINVLGDNPETIIKAYNWTYFLDPGEYNVTVWSSDAAGNEGSDTVLFNVSPASADSLDIVFIPPTENDEATINNNYTVVNVSANHTSNNISTLINFDNSLVGWWTMDNVSGATVVDQMNLNNGTAINQATQNTSGALGSSFEFDGTTDYINFTNADEVNITGDRLTVGGWINLDADEGAFIAGVPENAGAPYENHYFIRYNGANDIRFATSTTNQDVFYTTTTNPISINTWHHVIGVYNSTHMIIYVDGVAIGTPQLQNGTLTNNNESFKIGTDLGSGSDIDGRLDDVMVFNRSLSEDEVIALYANSSSRYLANNFTNLSAGNHTFQAYTQDTEGSINYTELREIVVSLVADTSFTVSLPTGYVDVNFSANLKNTSEVNASGQNSTLGVLYVTNTGNVGLDVFLEVNATASGFTVYADTDNNSIGATIINTTSLLLKDNLGSSSSQNIWMWANWTDKTPQTVERKLNVSVQEN